MNIFNSTGFAVVEQLPGVEELIPTGLSDALGLPEAVSEKLLFTAVTVLTAWLVRRLLVRWFVVGLSDKRLQYQWRKGISYAVSGVAALVVATIWIDGFSQVGTFLGLLTAGIAIALRDVVADVAGWIVIMWKRPFRLGDRIQIGSHSGDVVDISLLQFSILEIGNWVAADQSTGRLIHIPNAHVLTAPLANYVDQFPFVWHEIPVLVTFESDWRAAKAILEEIVEEESRGVEPMARDSLQSSAGTMLISYDKLSGTVYTSVRDDGVLLTLRFLVAPRQRRGAEQRVWEAILDAFDAVDSISLAYRTQRLFRSSEDFAAEARGRWEGGVPPASADR